MRQMTWHFAVWTLLLVALAAAMPAQAQEKRPWRVADSFRTQSIGELQVAPGGGQVVFVLSRKDLARNASYASIWTFEPGSGDIRPLTEPEGNASSPRFSPDGDRIAWFAADEEGLGLWTMNADGSGKKKLAALERSNAYLTYGGTGNKLAWSPDGSTIAYNAAGERHYENDIEPPHLPTGNEVMVIDRLLHKAAYFYSDLRRTHVWTIPASGGEPRRLTSGDYDYHSFSWSPDGKTIACVSNRTGADDFNSNNDIVFVSAESGAVEQVLETPGPEYQVTWSPDGRRVAYEGRERSGRSKESDAELVKIYVKPADGSGPGTSLSGPVDRWANGFAWGPGGREVYFTVQNEGRVELLSAPAAGGAAETRIAGRGQVGAFAVAGDGTIYYAWSDFTTPAELYRLEPGGGAERLTSFHRDLIGETAVADAEHFSFDSFDGLAIDGWVMRPYDYEPGGKYPLILHIHGGPHGQLGWRFSGRFQEYAAHGYAVLFFNPRGSTGRGQEFSDLVVGDIGGGDYRDLMIGLDHALDRYPFLDSARMGVTGTSYGGYMTNWITTHTDRFKAAVPVSGISNLVSAWSEGANFLWFESDMEFMPFENYEKAWDVSPLKYVANAKTPTLFVNGRWDFITTLNQADAMFVALKKLGVDTQIALYPHEGHGVNRQPAHTADYHARSIAWFDEYLK